MLTLLETLCLLEIKPLKIKIAMLAKDPYGEKITIDEIFNNLTTHLYRVKTQKLNIDDFNLIYLQDIEQNIFAFKPSDSLRYLEGAINTIEGLLRESFEYFKYPQYQFFDTSTYDEELGFNLEGKSSSEGFDYQSEKRNETYHSLVSHLSLILGELNQLKEAIAAQDLGRNLDIGNIIEFKPILMTKGGTVNAIVTVLKRILNVHIDTSQANLIRVIMAVFRDKDGELLKKSTIESILKDPAAESKKV